jgi:hypothetical protein
VSDRSAIYRARQAGRLLASAAIACGVFGLLGSVYLVLATEEAGFGDSSRPYVIPAIGLAISSLLTSIVLYTIGTYIEGRSDEIMSSQRKAE